ncbi:cystatin-2-like [Hyperolius riggenbachi]|uniref:cystatin-2-like n=1 Tax=Hyperolius riggenbachi TaxID=752182 RepID=UPI0035A33627
MAAGTYLCIIAGLCFVSTIGQMAGGWRKRNTDDKAIIDVAKIAVTDYNHRSNDIYFIKFMKVISAQSQVVAGTNYDLHVKVGKTNCRKNGNAANADSNSCVVNQVLTCYFEVYQRSWENYNEVTKSSCS